MDEEILERVLPLYKDKNGDIHRVLIETFIQCISDTNGNRLDNIIENIQNDINDLGGQMSVSLTILIN